MKKKNELIERNIGDKRIKIEKRFWDKYDECCDAIEKLNPKLDRYSEEHFDIILEEFANNSPTKTNIKNILEDLGRIKENEK